MTEVSLSFASLFADDIVALSGYYQRLFGLDEVESLRSPHFRGLQIGPTVLGFSASATAYDLLQLPRPRADEQGVATFLTFEVRAPELVDSTFAAALLTGGRQVQAPHDTYYGAWQAVVLDPEGNAFRINHLPELHPAV